MVKYRDHRLPLHLESMSTVGASLPVSRANYIISIATLLSLLQELIGVWGGDYQRNPDMDINTHQKIQQRRRKQNAGSWIFSIGSELQKHIYMLSLDWFKSSPLSTNKYLALSIKNSADAYKLWVNLLVLQHGREAGGRWKSSYAFNRHLTEGNNLHPCDYCTIRGVLQCYWPWTS